MAGRGAHVVYSALIFTYSCERSEKKTSVSAPSPGSVISYSTSSRLHGLRRARPRRSRSRRRPSRRGCPRSRCRRAQRGVSRQRGADGLDDPAPVGVAAVQRGLDERRVGDGARDGLDAPRRARRGRARARSGAAPSPSATIRIASWRSSASSASPKRSSSSLSGSIAHAAGAGAHQDRGVVGGELAVDRAAVEGALDADAEQQVGGLGLAARRRSARSRASWRSSARSCPAPLHWALRRTVPEGSATSRLARFSKASVVWIACWKSRVAVAAQLGAARRGCPAAPASTGSKWLIPPVEASATSARLDARGRARRRPGSWRRRRARAVRSRRWRSRSWRARRAARPGGSARWLSSTGAAGVPVAVKRAALTGCSESQTSRPRSGLPLGLIPQATPAARKPAGRPASGPSSRTCAGAGTQRE